MDINTYGYYEELKNLTELAANSKYKRSIGSFVHTTWKMFDVFKVYDVKESVLPYVSFYLQSIAWQRIRELRGKKATWGESIVNLLVDFVKKHSKRLAKRFHNLNKYKKKARNLENVERSTRGNI